MYHIFHSFETRFSLLDRLRIMFGKPVMAKVKIQTGDENVLVLSIKTDVWVDKFKMPVRKKQYAACQGDCGFNYCDENGCTERKRYLVDLCSPSEAQEPPVNISIDEPEGP